MSQSIRRLQPSRTIRLLLLLGYLPLFFPALSPGQGLFGDEVLGCPFAGRRPTAGELESILAAHRKWLMGDPSGQRANLCEANLSKASLIGDLRKANLRKANLSGAVLWSVRSMNPRIANLAEANLSEANLRKAMLLMANLYQANLRGADLSEAELGGANLSKANLEDADLRMARLWAANLSHANLWGADLREASLSRARLDGLIFEPRWLPDPLVFMSTEGLSEMTYSRSRHGLAALRQAFETAGLRQQEREVTYAVKRTDRLMAWKRDWLGKIDSIFNFALFESPCAYGMYPGRPLRILFLLILGFSFPYMIAIGRGKGIKAVWPEKLLRDNDPDAVSGKSVHASPDLFFPRLRRMVRGQLSRRLVRRAAQVTVGVYFSLLSAFHIGWRELSVGTWLSRIQPREYTLVATGWVRTVSGVQSILSVYLLALWVLTYFGRPFQ